MIFIFSSSYDLSTDLVIDWLNYYKYPFFRFNSEDIFDQAFKIDLLNETIYFKGVIIPIEKVKAIWFRKIWITKTFQLFKEHKLDFESHLRLHKEHLSVFKTLYYLLKKKEWLTNPNNSMLNKCSVILEAKSAGLNVPETHIVNSKRDVLEFAKSNRYIIKSSNEPVSLFDEGLYTMYTKSISEKLTDKFSLPEIISPSLVQEKIEKDYEIRTFFLREKFYSMAIFSQENTRTKEDFRDIDWSKSNRVVPYKLPTEIEKKTKRVMRMVGLNCGSIDYIKGVDGKYYFLEINPVGQYGMVDFPCNYNLNKEIALELMRMDGA